VISIHEVFIVSVISCLIIAIFWKWNKSFLIIIIIELITTFFIVRLLLRTGRFFVIITVFIFFVREALILISSLYNSLRLVGRTYGNVTFI